jgi:putative membrane protein
MWAHAFFDEATKAQAAEVVKGIEARTAAEVVVAVRRASGHYRHTDYLVGFALALVTLVAMLYLPPEFPLEAFPVDVALSFATGTAVSAVLPGLRRRLTASALQEAYVRMAARSTFVELGVSRTSGRTGILVFVSVFERRVEVVADVGVDAAALGSEWEAALARLSAAVASSESPEPFLEALQGLAAPLARVLPRSEDDVNELPDAPHHAA